MLGYYLRKTFLLAILLIGALSIAPALAQPQSWTQAGMLRCNLNPSIGFVIFGHQSMECTFQPVSGPVQAYQGAINTVGQTSGSVAAAGSLGPSSARRQGYLRHARGGICRGLWRYWFGGWRRRQRAGGRLKPQRRFAARLPQGSIAINAVAGLSQLKLRPVQM